MTRRTRRSDRAVLELLRLEDRTTPAGFTGTGTGTGTAVPPTANDDFTDTDGNNPDAVHVHQNDSGANGISLNPASVRVVAGPGRGTATVNPGNGDITYTATGFATGTDSFQYTVKDTAGLESNPATVSVVINRPTANDDFADTDGNNPVQVFVLGNDTDPDGNDKLDIGSLKIVTPPAHGTVQIVPLYGDPLPSSTTAPLRTYVIEYTAAGDFTGTDTFRYTVSDDAGAESAPGTVTIVVNRPHANDDTAFTFGTAPVTVNVLANDTDPDGNEELDPGSVKIVSGPANGAVAVDPATGAMTYTPKAGFIGSDTFTYTVTDFPGAESNPATVRIRVDAPAEKQITAAGVDAGGGPRVNVFNTDGTLRASFFAFEQSFTGGVRVAVGDVTGDGTPDVIVGAGLGGAPLVKVYDGVTLKEIASFYAYEASFRGGVYVSAGDVNGDGVADVITGAGDTGGPVVKVFDGATAKQLASYFAFEDAFRGGVQVGVSDVTGDGRADIVASAGPGGGPHVVVFDGVSGAMLASFFAFDASLTNGASVAAGDVNGDGFADIIVGAGAGGSPHVKVFDGRTGDEVQSFFAFEPSFSGGVRVAAADVNQDGRADLILAPGPGKGFPVAMVDAFTLQPIANNEALATYTGGAFVGGHG